MEKVGIDSKIIDITQQSYRDTQCAISVAGYITEYFLVNVGVRLGCLLFPMYFNIMPGFEMSEVHSLDTNVQLSNTITIDIRYADDIILISTQLKLPERVTEKLS